jgi:hypothetical protein
LDPREKYTYHGAGELYVMRISILSQKNFMVIKSREIKFAAFAACK